MWLYYIYGKREIIGLDTITRQKSKWRTLPPSLKTNAQAREIIDLVMTRRRKRKWRPSTVVTKTFLNVPNLYPTHFFFLIVKYYWFEVLIVKYYWFEVVLFKILQRHSMLWKDGGVMVGVLAPSVVDRGFEHRSGQTKDHRIGICCFSAKHVALRRNSKDWLARNRNNVSEWSDFSTHGLLF